MEIRRKIQIGLGIVLLISGLATNSSFWGVGIFMILWGFLIFALLAAMVHARSNQRRQKKNNRT